MGGQPLQGLTREDQAQQVAQKRIRTWLNMADCERGWRGSHSVDGHGAISSSAWAGAHGPFPLAGLGDTQVSQDDLPNLSSLALAMYRPEAMISAPTPPFAAGHVSQGLGWWVKWGLWEEMVLAQHRGCCDPGSWAHPLSHVHVHSLLPPPASDSWGRDRPE